MNIKSLKPSRKSGFIQGYINLNECKKYQGSGPIIFRSSWERKFVIYCERTPEITKWTSESISIKYFSPLDQKYHQYFPDFIISLHSGETIIIEIKPKNQLIKPEHPKRKTQKSLSNYKWLYERWVLNMCKKEAAENYAKSLGWNYMIITENFFKGK